MSMSVKNLTKGLQTDLNVMAGNMGNYAQEEARKSLKEFAEAVKSVLSLDYSEPEKKDEKEKK